MKKSVKKNPNFNRNLLIGAVILILIFVVAFNFAGKDSNQEGLAQSPPPMKGAIENLRKFIVENSFVNMVEKSPEDLFYCGCNTKVYLTEKRINDGWRFERNWNCDSNYHFDLNTDGPFANICQDRVLGARCQYVQLSKKLLEKEAKGEDVLELDDSGNPQYILNRNEKNCADTRGEYCGCEITATTFYNDGRDNKIEKRFEKDYPEDSCKNDMGENMEEEIEEENIEGTRYTRKSLRNGIIDRHRHNCNLIPVPLA